MRTIKRTLLSLLLLSAPLAAQAETALPGLKAPVTVVRDSSGIPHIFADTKHDVFFMQGWVHAQDRLFQMDTTRRGVAGTLAELFGPDAVPNDVAARTLGLNRAAERSLAAHPRRFKALLKAYSDGVNAYIEAAEAANALPPEYDALQLSQVARWRPLDSIMVGKGLAFLTSFKTDDIDASVTLGAYEAVGTAAGFDGRALFFEDLFRSAPFDPASTVPDAEQNTEDHDHATRTAAQRHRPRIGSKARALGRAYLEKLRRLPRIPGLPRSEASSGSGSNTWVVSGAHTRSGRPLLANDPHLALDSPTIFHQMHLVAPGLDVIGSGVAGLPCVVRGHNRHLAWGLTNSRLDITDVYAEAIVPDMASPSGLSILHKGRPEPIELLKESFSANVGGAVVPVHKQDVLIVPRRNNGPIITKPEWDPDLGVLTALSVQSTGFSATRDPEGVCGLNRARGLGEFTAALQLVDFASQNVSYADTKGNIAYFVTGEVPLREDLQAAAPGDPVAPPFLIRDGTGGQEWIPDPSPPPRQAVRFKILPFKEMPHTVNPPSGVIINANNDQAGNSLDNDPLNDPRPGGGLFYLNWGGRNFSIRAGRITRLLDAALDDDDRLSVADMIEAQADVVMLDAQVFTPAILRAFDRASSRRAHPALAAFAADPRVAEAVARLDAWDHSTPTGIPEGYDAGWDADDDDDGNGPDQDAIRNSVAATIYAVWRRALAANTIDATLAGVGLPPLVNEREERVTALRHLLDSFETNRGVGASGLDFFPGPGDADAATRRDIAILKSLADALDRLASDAFAAAFHNSTDQDDYRWGRLHRIVFRHPLGGAAKAFNVPPGFGFFPPPLKGLDGIPTDGGFETVDQGRPVANIEAPGSDSFMYSLGATGRFVSRLGRHRVRAVTSLPGGESAVPGSPFYLNLLEPWLLNETHPLLVSPGRVQADAVASETFVPPES